jgi:hypothetical protein
MEKGFVFDKQISQLKVIATVKDRLHEMKKSEQKPQVARPLSPLAD